MENYLNCKKVDTAINRAKVMLINRAKTSGIYENFGQIEVKEIREKFIKCGDYSMETNKNRNKIFEFECWCINYTGK